MMIRPVYVEGREKGELYKRGPHWVWHRGRKGGTDDYPRGTTLDEIKKHIARVNRSTPDKVIFGPLTDDGLGD